MIDLTPIREKEKQMIKPPSKYGVIFINDDFTPMNFVIDILKTIFMHPSDIAEALTLEVHQKGQAVVGVYAKDVAETKALTVTKEAQANEHPLKVNIKPID